MKKAGIIFLTAILALSVAACSSSETAQITQEESDRVVSERDALQQQEDDLLEQQEALSNNSSDTTENLTEPDDQEEPVESQQPQTTEQVLVDQNGVKITYTGIGHSLEHTEFNLRIENNSEIPIMLYPSYLSVNGIMVVGFMSESAKVMPGKTANDGITMLDAYLEENGLSPVENIELSFVVYSADTTRETIFESDVVTIQVK